MPPPENEELFCTLPVILHAVMVTGLAAWFLMSSPPPALAAVLLRKVLVLMASVPLKMKAESPPPRVPAELPEKIEPETTALALVEPASLAISRKSPPATPPAPEWLPMKLHPLIANPPVAELGTSASTPPAAPALVFPLITQPVSFT